MVALSTVPLRSHLTNLLYFFIPASRFAKANVFNSSYSPLFLHSSENAEFSLSSKLAGESYSSTSPAPSTSVLSKSIKVRSRSVTKGGEVSFENKVSLK